MDIHIRIHINDYSFVVTCTHSACEYREGPNAIYPKHPSRMDLKSDTIALNKLWLFCGHTLGQPGFQLIL